MYLLLVFLFLSGCASYDELWAEAEKTGDWSKVRAMEDSKREKMRQDAAHEYALSVCEENDRILYCVSNHAGKINYEEDCTCITRGTFRGLFGR